MQSEPGGSVVRRDASLDSFPLPLHCSSALLPISSPNEHERDRGGPAAYQRGVDARSAGRPSLGLEPAAAPAAIAAAARRRAPGYWACWRAMPRSVSATIVVFVGSRTAGRAAGGGDSGRRAPDCGQLRPLGAPGEVGGDLRQRGLE